MIPSRFSWLSRTPTRAHGRLFALACLVMLGLAGFLFYHRQAAINRLEIQLAEIPLPAPFTERAPTGAIPSGHYPAATIDRYLDTHPFEPTILEGADALGWLTSPEARHGATVLSLDRGELQLLSSYTALPITITMRGTPADLAFYLDGIERTPALLMLDTLTIVPAAQTTHLIEWTLKLLVYFGKPV